MPACCLKLQLLLASRMPSTQHNTTLLSLLSLKTHPQDAFITDSRLSSSFKGSQLAMKTKLLKTACFRTLALWEDKGESYVPSQISKAGSQG